MGGRVINNGRRDDLGVGSRDRHVKDEMVTYRRETWYGLKNGEWVFFKRGKDLRWWEQNICYCRRCHSKWRGEPYEVFYLGAGAK